MKHIITVDADASELRITPEDARGEATLVVIGCAQIALPQKGGRALRVIMRRPRVPLPPSSGLYGTPAFPVGETLTSALNESPFVDPRKASCTKKSRGRGK